MKYFVKSKISKINGTNDPETKGEKQVEEGTQTIPPPLEQSQTEGEGNRKQAEGYGSLTEANATTVQLHHPHCWSRDQVNYLLSTYPWIMSFERKIGCRGFTIGQERSCDVLPSLPIWRQQSKLWGNKLVETLIFAPNLRCKIYFVEKQAIDAGLMPLDENTTNALLFLKSHGLLIEGVPKAKVHNLIYFLPMQ